MVLGCILVRLEINHSVVAELTSQSIFSCATTEGAYIMTIGVVDEA